MNDKQKTKLENRLKEIENILNSDDAVVEAPNGFNSNLLSELNDIQFKLDKQNINFTLKSKKKYYYANQCKQFENNLKKYGYGRIKKEDILKDGVCFNNYSINNGYNQYCRDIKRFNNKEELLGFVVGYNQSIFNKENY